MKIAPVMVASIPCIVGCRQLLGIDSPSVGDGPAGSGSDAFVPHDAGADGAASTHFVQGSGAEATTTVSATLSNVADGDLLIVAASAVVTFAAFPSDTDGNVYQSLIGTSTTNGFLQLYTATAGVSATGLTTITLNIGSNNAVELVAAEYRHVQTLVTDGTITANGSSSQLASGSITTANSDDVLVAVGASITALHPVAPFAARVQSPASLDLLEDRETSAAGTYDASETSGGGLWLIALVAFPATP